MSNNYQNWEDDDDFDFEDEQTSQRNSDNPTDLVKQLRKQLRMEQKKAKELEARVNEFSSKQREEVIKNVLAERGVNPKVAKLIPADVDATNESALNEWLEEFGDAFGIQQTESSESYDGLKKINSATSTAASPTTENDFERLLEQASTEEDLYRLMQNLS
jgi:hypothetical protein